MTRDDLQEFYVYDKIGSAGILCIFKGRIYR